MLLLKKSDCLVKVTLLQETVNEIFCITWNIVLLILNSKTIHTHIPTPPRKGIGSKPLDEPFR